jgi:hypothetical protein
MLKGNATPTTLNSDDSFKQIISEARISHQRSKDGATEAAANAYMLWLSTQSDQATKEAAAWIKKEIELANETIAAHNEDVKKKQERANKFKSGTLPDDDAINEKPRNPAHAAEIEKMRDKLRDQSQWDKKIWARLRQMPIEARDGASRFTEIVKYVFQFNEVQHSDQVARYSTVLEWVHSQFKDNAPKEKDEIVAAIRNFGGFEEVLFEQRRIKSGDADDTDDRKTMSDAIREDIKHALVSVNPIATIDHEARFEKEGFVMFLGRKSGGQVSLVSELEMTDSDLQSALSSVGSDIDIPNPQNSEFVARVLELGKLVSEGQEIARTYDSTKSGDKIRVQRVLAYRPSKAAEGAEFVISARAADASPIIYARPKTVSHLGVPPRPVMLSFKTRKRIEYFLRDPNVRRHIEIQAEQSPKRADDTDADSPLAWVGGNVVLLGKSSKNAQQKFYWTDLVNVDEKPLDIENFQPQFASGIDDVELDGLYEQALRAWAAAKNPNKASATATFKFQNDKLLVRIAEQEELELKLAKSCGGKFTLAFRMRELHDLVALLLRQRTSDFSLRGDEGGLLEISWEDSLGYYWVYLPTVNQEGKLQSRRVGPMRLAAADMIAAE